MEGGVEWRRNGRKIGERERMKGERAKENEGKEGEWEKTGDLN